MTTPKLHPVEGLPDHIRVTASTLAQIAAQSPELRESVAMALWGIENGQRIIVEHGPHGPTAWLCTPLCQLDPAAVQTLIENGTLHPSGDGLFQGISQTFGPLRQAELDLSEGDAA